MAQEYQMMNLTACTKRQTFKDLLNNGKNMNSKLLKEFQLANGILCLYQKDQDLAVSNLISWHSGQHHTELKKSSTKGWLAESITQMEFPILKASEDVLSHKKSWETRFERTVDRCTLKKLCGHPSGSIKNPSRQTGCKSVKERAMLEHPGLREQAVHL